MEDEMFDLMNGALNFAESRCDEVEFYGESAAGLSVEIERWHVKNVRRLSSCGIGVRVVVGKSVGFSYTTEMSKRALERCVEEAVKRARSSEDDADFSGFPAASSYRTPVGTYDRDILEMCDACDEDAIAEAIERCDEMLNGVRAHKQCRPTDGGFSVAYDMIFVMNSNGVEVSDMGTFVSAGITVVARDDVSKEEVSGSEGEAKRALRDLNLRWIGEEASRIASESIGGEKAATRETAVILSPRAVQSILAYTTIPHLSAENVQRNRSPYRGKIGEQIASEMLTIIDDGTAAGMLNTRKMDGEGVPSQRTVLIERGILRTFLYDSYTASKDGVESTGNAVRGYDHTPVIGATNFCIVHHDIATREEILRDVRDGIFVNDVIGAHTASPTSGDFSVVAQNAFAVRRGELKPLKGVMIVGNSVEMLRRVALIASDSRQIYNVASPTILISGIQVVSADASSAPSAACRGGVHALSVPHLRSVQLPLAAATTQQQNAEADKKSIY